ncbi:MAG: ribonuclease HI [Helicobacteraceae bacterium]|jgi:ribonuclease HI|nr:ribonuclease HI [Helicobacteraceae bacterium]
MSKIQIFTDGTCSPNPGAGGWCAIVRYGDREDKIINGGENNTTNNRMELKPVIEALKTLKEPSKVELVSYSPYVVRAIDGTYENLKENLDLWAEYAEASKGHKVTARYVEEHSGHLENERCRKMANAQIELHKSSL